MRSYPAAAAPPRALGRDGRIGSGWPGAGSVAPAAGISPRVTRGYPGVANADFRAATSALVVLD